MTSKRVVRPLEEGVECLCGVDLPVHLAELAADGWGPSWEHVCSCERVWRVVEGNLVHVGDTAPNPCASLPRTRSR